jgi:hypothetical protein
VTHRRPSIRNARRLLQWEPKVLLAETIDKTLTSSSRTPSRTATRRNAPGVETPVRATEAAFQRSASEHGRRGNL